MGFPAYPDKRLVGNTFQPGQFILCPAARTTASNMNKLLSMRRFFYGPGNVRVCSILSQHPGSNAGLPVAPGKAK